LIPAMVLEWRKGYDVVNMRRRTRAGESWLKRRTAQAFYAIMRRIGPVEMPENVGDFRMLSRKALDALNRMPERNRMMKGMLAWIGFSVKEIAFDRAPREAGSTKWNYLRLWGLAVEGITSATTAPLKTATVLGLLLLLAAVLYGAAIAAGSVTGGGPVHSYAGLMVVLLFVGGLQLTAIGVVGEYLGRVFMETKNRPLYLVKHHHVAATARRVIPRVTAERLLP
jgi:hypothetical protein